MDCQQILLQQIASTRLKVLNAQYRTTEHQQLLTIWVKKHKSLISVVSTLTIVGGWFLNRKVTMGQKVKQLTRYGLVRLLTQLKRYYLLKIS